MKTNNVHAARSMLANDATLRDELRRVRLVAYHAHRFMMLYACSEHEGESWGQGDGKDSPAHRRFEALEGALDNYSDAYGCADALKPTN